MTAITTTQIRKVAKELGITRSKAADVIALGNTEARGALLDQLARSFDETRITDPEVREVLGLGATKDTSAQKVANFVNTFGKCEAECGEDATHDRIGHTNDRETHHAVCDTCDPSTAVIESPVQAIDSKTKETAMGTIAINWTDEVKTAEVKDAEGNVTTAASFAAGTCRCGCGAEVGKGSKFRPGHDARYKGILIRAAVAGDTIVVNGESKTPLEAAYTDEFDYRENVQRALDTAAKSGATAEERKVAADAKKAERDAAKAEEKAKRDAKRAEDKAARDAEKAEKAEAKRLATLAAAEAKDLAKASGGTVDPAQVEEVTPAATSAKPTVSTK